MNKFKHNEAINLSKIKLIDFISFFMGFSEAMLLYVLSTYFTRALGNDNIGIFYFVSYLIALPILLNLHKFVRISGKTSIFYFIMILEVLITACLVILPVSLTGAFFLVAYITLVMLSWAVLDGIIESFSSDRTSGRIRGSHLAIMNTGFVLGPFLSSQILEKYDFYGIFALILIINCSIISFALFALRGTNHKFNKIVSSISSLKKILKRKDISRIYYISFILEVFYALMVAYVPIYLLDKGFNWEQLGVAFTIMLIPFIILQYPVGVLADKKFGEKEMLIFAIIVIGISSATFYFIESKEIIIWTAILFSTRVGAAFIEVLRDSYFYKRIDGTDIDVIHFFRTSKSVAYIVSMFLAMIAVMLFSVKAVFALVAIISLSALYPAFRLVDNKAESEQGVNS